jgi:hypothetical protein
LERVGVSTADDTTATTTPDGQAAPEPDAPRPADRRRFGARDAIRPAVIVALVAFVLLAFP